MSERQTDKNVSSLRWPRPAVQLVFDRQRQSDANRFGGPTNVDSPNSSVIHVSFSEAVRIATANALPIPRNEAATYKRDQDDFAWSSTRRTAETARHALRLGGLTRYRTGGCTSRDMSLLRQDDKYLGQQGPIAGYLHGLSVRDGFRGLALGVCAINWCTEVVRLDHREHLRLDCELKNVSLCANYELMGFVCVGTKPFSSG